jgi:hypothetical protein
MLLIAEFGCHEDIPTNLPGLHPSVGSGVEVDFLSSVHFFIPLFAPRFRPATPTSTSEYSSTIFLRI